MAREIYQGTTQDGQGRVLSEATVSVYEAGTTTAANVYTAASGGSAVNSVDSDTDGHFLFYVDTGDYALSQKFKIIVTKTSPSYTSTTWDNIRIFTATTVISAFMETLLDDADAATARTTLGLAIGTDVQAYDATLAALAALTLAADKMIYATGADAVSTTDLTSFARTMLANANSADWVADSGMLALANEYTKNQNLDEVTLTDGTTAVDFETDGNAYLLLEENTTLSAPTNLVAGRAIDLRVVQDATGGRTLSFNAAYDFGSNESSVNTGSNEVTWYHFKTDGTNVYCTKWWNPA